MLDSKYYAIYIRSQRLLVIVQIIGSCGCYLPSIYGCAGGIVANKPDAVRAQSLKISQRQAMCF